MSEEEFCQRFYNRLQLLLRAGRKAPVRDPETYTKAVAPSYWRELGQQGWSPEQCADHDAAFW
ncbi:hypothetical protein FHX15_001831 [Rhizobium sp. BK650]|uniref:hypothetical protein n=1 Tax=Rhizobium sp. BK650 TaxID=2586990 RepID=UPI001618DC56|nr:hypothetical protein [Rhizobium sp. BK650]MBB3656603.1 hypothetical protein [Rhizobium sp. BK650]